MSTQEEMRSFDQTYSNRSTFYRVVGAAAKLNAEAWQQADLENRAEMKEIIFEAMVHYLVEREGYSRAEDFSAARSPSSEEIEHLKGEVERLKAESENHRLNSLSQGIELQAAEARNTCLQALVGEKDAALEFYATRWFTKASQGSGELFPQGELLVDQGAVALAVLQKSEASE